MPAHYTTNPRTGTIDYIQVQPELLSLAAFTQGAKATCGRTDGGDIQVVIPAYISEDHFQRALPLLPGVLRVSPGPLYHRLSMHCLPSNARNELVYWSAAAVICVPHRYAYKSRGHLSWWT